MRDKRAWAGLINWWLLLQSDQVGDKDVLMENPTASKYRSFLLGQPVSAERNPTHFYWEYRSIAPVFGLRQKREMMGKDDGSLSRSHLFFNSALHP